MPVKEFPRPAIEFDLLMLQVDRLSMLYPDGEITRMLNRITQSVLYKIYYDKILRIPADSQLKAIEMKSAPQLRTIKVLGRNNALESLNVNKCAIRRLPSSLKYLQQLDTLAIDRGLVDILSLEALHGIRNLTDIQLSRNKLHRLEVSKDPTMVLPIERLYLPYNLLEFVDIQFFTPFKRLRDLDLTSNRLKQIIVNRPVALPLLFRFLLPQNLLMQLNCSNWIMPKLGALSLSMNNLKQLPFGIGQFTELETLFLNNNQLTILDLQHLERLHKLTNLQIIGNRLHTILLSPTSQKHRCRRVSLPAMQEISFSDNFLTNIDFNLWNMPALKEMSLENNRLQRLRNFYKKFPNLKIIYVRNNSIRCSDIVSMKKYLESKMVQIEVKTDKRACSTSSSFPHPTKAGVICCND
uniref:Putative leucine-rich repeat protein n=1 Tax=Anopheles darlingi TaxID=43151 RepID=A0A2M4CKW0_ANODA